MTSLNPRETRLAVATAVIILLGVTFLVVQGKITQLKELADRQEEAELTNVRQQILMRKRPEILQELETIRGQLPRHPEGRDLKPVFLRQVQSVAREAGLQLNSMNAEPEQALPDLELYRSAVTGSWSGSPAQFLDFLVRLQQLGPVSDVSFLRIRKQPGKETAVRGTFNLEFAYARVPMAEGPSTAPADPESRMDGVDP